MHRAVLLDVANGTSDMPMGPVRQLEQMGLVRPGDDGGFVLTEEGASVEAELRSQLDTDIAARRDDEPFMRRIRKRIPSLPLRGRTRRPRDQGEAQLLGPQVISLNVYLDSEAHPETLLSEFGLGLIDGAPLIEAIADFPGADVYGATVDSIRAATPGEVASHFGGDTESDADKPSDDP